jgi:hypothetical protein
VASYLQELTLQVSAAAVDLVVQVPLVLLEQRLSLHQLVVVVVGVEMQLRLQPLLAALSQRSENIHQESVLPALVVVVVQVALPLQ